MSDPGEHWRPDTRAVRAGLDRSGFEDEEASEALYLTSGFVYERAADAEAAFAGEVERFVYSRYANPTVAAFEERLRRIEGAPACYATRPSVAAGRDAGRAATARSVEVARRTQRGTIGRQVSLPQILDLGLQRGIPTRVGGSSARRACASRHRSRYARASGVLVRGASFARILWFQRPGPFTRLSCLR